MKVDHGLREFSHGERMSEVGIHATYAPLPGLALYKLSEAMECFCKGSEIGEPAVLRRRRGQQDPRG